MNTVKFKASGFVYGYYWGGGEGAYKAEDVEALTLEELEDRINDGIKKGWLDSGMGYESLIGAVMYVTRIETRIFKGREWHNEEENTGFYGNLTECQIEFLENVLM